jgi:FtsH-binding integral membrane protein
LKQTYTVMQWVLGIATAFCPYVAGFVVIMTLNIRVLALVGIIVCLGCTSGAYFLRRKNKQEEAKHRLIIDPILYGSEFVFTAVLIRYLFLNRQ